MNDTAAKGQTQDVDMLHVFRAVLQYCTRMLFDISNRPQYGTACSLLWYINCLFVFVMIMAM